MSTLTEAEVIEQLSAQHTKYISNPDLVGEAVQTDQDARVVMANASHAVVTSTTAGFKAGLNVQAVAPESGNIVASLYTGGNVVTPVNATIMEAGVRTALDADELFTYGGPYTSDYSLASPYVDNLTLIQGSLLTGEKFF